MPKTAVIIGAGPAGLTAAFELITRTDIKPIVLEKSSYMGGIARTLNHNGNRMDIGGHRFFSKSERVMQWWLDRMPLQALPMESVSINYHRMSRSLAVAADGPDPERENRVMLLRPRKSRIYFLRKFFAYPISLSLETISKLGIIRTVRIGLSYARSVLFPMRSVKNLEQFFTNRFGKELYLTFFKSYTEKVWGVPCEKIGAEWGEQRIKGLSITKTLRHAMARLFSRPKAELDQRGTETSLIEHFLYPKLGPGQMWEYVAEEIRALGGEVRTEVESQGVGVDGNRVTGVYATDLHTGETMFIPGDYVFSTMPVRELIPSLRAEVPANVREVSDGLIYRDFIVVGLLVSRLRVNDDAEGKKRIKDNWIYIQEPDVLAGRLQIFNNWSPYMVSDTSKTWLGVEYFCNESDDLWSKPEAEMARFAAEELDKIGILDKGDVLDSYVFRMPKTYPAYFGAYERFQEIVDYVDRFENLFLIGRNGMHRYNNQDHSMLTAMLAVDNILAGRTDKSNLWSVNTEMEYHENQASE